MPDVGPTSVDSEIGLAEMIEELRRTLRWKADTCALWPTRASNTHQQAG